LEGDDTGAYQQQQIVPAYVITQGIPKLHGAIDNFQIIEYTVAKLSLK
jgi:hypothetical protein